MNRNMKTKFLLIGVIVVSAIFISSHKENKNIDLLLENIDAYAGSDEHGDIDETLVPYSKLGEKTIYCILDGKMLSTKIPCCKPDASKFSGCAKGLDNC